MRMGLGGGGLHWRRKDDILSIRKDWGNWQEDAAKKHPGEEGLLLRKVESREAGWAWN